MGLRPQAPARAATRNRIQPTPVLLGLLSRLAVGRGLVWTPVRERVASCCKSANRHWSDTGVAAKTRSASPTGFDELYTIKSTDWFAVGRAA